MKASNIKYIVIHCTAGFAPAEKVQDYFLRPVSKGGRGWKTGGYHRIIDQDGTVHEMYPFSRTTNGVKGYNAEAIHISYVGGIEVVKGSYVAKDTRTLQQKISLVKTIQEAISWLQLQGKDITKDLTVLGHRDFSTDKNRNGVIDSRERIKECPSFDPIPEYRMYSATNEPLILPANQ